MTIEAWLEGVVSVSVPLSLGLSCGNMVLSVGGAAYGRNRRCLFCIAKLHCSGGHRR
ncbi:MAG: hypothetical protein MJ137_05065 [Clostridia bacterium]|nr:hypothetical protein [Clostridia bacterium]